MRRNGSEIRFCDECPSRQEYIGEVNPDHIETNVEIGNKGYLYQRGYDSDEWVHTNVRFVDSDGCSSEETGIISSFSELRDKGIEISVKDGGKVRHQKRIKSQLQAAVEEGATEIVERIGNCDGPSSDGDGERSCPALSETFLERVVTSALDRQS